MSGGAVSAVGALHARAVFARRVRVLSEAIAELLPAGRVLDVGCGSGTIARAVGLRRPDVHPEGYDILVRRETEIPVRPFDGRRLPLEDGAADAAMLVDVLHHADDPLALLSECARVAPVVVVKDHLANGRFDERVLRFMDWVGNRPHGVVLPFHFYSAVSWAEALRAARLKETATNPVADLYPFPFSLLFGRRLHFVARLERG